MPKETTFIKHERHTHSQLTVRIYSDWQKKRRPTREKMDRPTRMKKKQAWMAYTPFLLLTMST